MGPDGGPLPFSTDEDVCDFLRAAVVHGIEKIPTGRTKPKKLLLVREGVRANAIFHYFRREERQMKLGRKTVSHYRDSYLNQVAAFEMGRLLGMANVPPTVLREIDGRKGSVTLWIEDAMTEKKRRKEGIEPDNLSTLNRHTHDMLVFDYLINNIDRHLDNMLHDSRWQFWLIDHTRAFGRDPGMLDIGKVRKCSKPLWTEIQSLDYETVSERLEPYMGKREIEALFKRRDRIVKRLRNKIGKEGEGEVLFDYDTP